VQKPESSIAPRERLKAFTEEKLVSSHGKLFCLCGVFSRFYRYSRIRRVTQRLRRSGDR